MARRVIWFYLLPAILSSAAGLWGASQVQTVRLPIGYVSDLAWDSTRSRIFASVGKEVLRIDPVTAAIDDRFAPDYTDRIAISDDGQYLYASLATPGVVRRYRLKDYSLDLEIPLGAGIQPNSMIVQPGHPRTLIIEYGYYPNPHQVAVYDDAVPRRDRASAYVVSLHTRPGDGALFGAGQQRLYRFSLNPNGVAVDREFSFPGLVDNYYDVRWAGTLMINNTDVVFDLAAETPIGAAAGCSLGPDSSGKFIVGVDASAVIQISLETMLTSGTATTDDQILLRSVCSGRAVALTPGVFAVAGQRGTPDLVLVRVSSFDPVPARPLPAPQIDPTGIITLAIPAQSLAYDATRNRIWASLPSSVGPGGNSIVDIDPTTGQTGDPIPVGSLPGRVVVTDDVSRAYVISAGANALAEINLESRKRTRLISLGTEGAYQPGALAAVPQHPESVLVIRRPTGFSYASEVSLYRDGVRQSNAVRNFEPGKFPFLGDQKGLITELFPGDAPNGFYAADLEGHDSTGRRDLRQLLVDNNGVTFSRALGPQALGDPFEILRDSGAMTYSNGSLFNASGQRSTPDGQILFGRYVFREATGIPIALPDQNRIAFVHEEFRSAGITVYDVTSMVPISTISLTKQVGTTYNRVVGAVRVGPQTIAVLTSEKLLLVPLSALQDIPAWDPTPRQLAPWLRQIDLPISAIAPLPGTSKLIASTPGSAGALGNRIVVLDTDTGDVEQQVFVGSEPTTLAVTPDGRSVYTWLSGQGRIARINLAAGEVDLEFSSDPAGQSLRYPMLNMAAGPDGGLAISYPGGSIAIFDNGVRRPVVDDNRQGSSSFADLAYDLRFDTSGGLLYAIDTGSTIQGFKRLGVTPQGLGWLSSADGLLGYGGRGVVYASGLLYTTRGDVVDPETSRRKGTFSSSPGWAYPVVIPDPGRGAVFFADGLEIVMYDAASYRRVGRMAVPTSAVRTAQQGFRIGQDVLAALTGDPGVDGQRLLLASVSRIAGSDFSSPVPQPAIPATPGVTVVDLAAFDLTYDPARDLIYASVPNREAANGDRIAVIDPASGAVTSSWPSFAVNPRILALSDEQDRLHYTAGAVPSWNLGGYSVTSEAVGGVDLTSGAPLGTFPQRANTLDYSNLIADMAPLPGQPGSLAIADGEGQYKSGVFGGVYLGPWLSSLRVFDQGVPRAEGLTAKSIDCQSMIAASAALLYCVSNSRFNALSVDSSGVRLAGSYPLPATVRATGRPAIAAGKLFSTAGQVIAPDSGSVLAQVETQGPVAVDGDMVWWLDPGMPESSLTVTLRAFNAGTLQALSTRTIHVTKNDVSRLVVCGQGRLAFRAGNEVYIVKP